MFTSNLGVDTLSKTFTEDIASLLKEACLPFHVIQKKDHREDIQKKIRKEFEE
jgi:hypothetical protein